MRGDEQPVLFQIYHVRHASVSHHRLEIQVRIENVVVEHLEAKAGRDSIAWAIRRRKSVNILGWYPNASDVISLDGLDRRAGCRGESRFKRPLIDAGLGIQTVQVTLGMAG